MKKNILMYLATFLAGAGAGFLTAKLVLEKKYAQLAEEEISSAREYYAKARPTRNPGMENENVAETEVQQESDRGVANPSGVMARKSIENPYEAAKRNYNLIKPTKVEDVEPVGTPDEDVDEDEDSEEDDELRDDAGMSEQDHLDLTKIDRTQPYLIDDREYTDEFPHHDKVSLYYYRDDDVLCEEDNEEPIDDIEGTVSYDALSVLDMQTTVWVRNEPLGIDYEIIGVRGSYSESILGVRRQEIMTPRERYVMEQRKKDRNGKGE